MLSCIWEIILSLIKIYKMTLNEFNIHRKSRLPSKSKSDESDYSRISLMDNNETIRKKIKKAKTADVLMPETEKEVNDLPEVNNLLNIFSGVTNQSKIELINAYSGKNFSGFKENLSEALVELISPINSEISKLMDDKNYLDSIIKKGAEKANDRATKTLTEVYDIVGFIKR